MTDLERPSRVPSLDGLRALSIIFVLWSHAQGTQGFPVWDWSWFNFLILNDGTLGVHIFFVISGFIITRLMLEEESQSGSVSLAGFYRRRAVRILPVYWTYLGTVTTLGLYGFFSFHFVGDILRPFTFSLGLSIWPKQICWQTAHTWSLAIEEQFYFVWPTLFVFCRPRWRTALILLTMIIEPILRAWMQVHPKQSGLNYTVFSNGDLIAWGCLVALIGNTDLLQRIVTWRPAIARVLAIVIIYFSPRYFTMAFNRRYPPLAGLALTMSVQAFSIAYLIASTTRIRSGIFFRILNWKWLSQIGILSYSLYIWQELFLAPAPAMHIWNRWPWNIVCVIAVACTSYYLIERPLFRFKRKNLLTTSAQLFRT